MRVVAEGLSFPEGPVVLEDGTVLVVEVCAGTIASVDPAARSVERIATTGGGPNGAALGPDGLLYVCNNGGFERQMDGCIQVLDLATGHVTTLYTECSGNALNAPNDLVFDSEGGFYFTDPGRARGRTNDMGVLYYAKADGSEITEVVFPMISPNGVGLSPAGDTVYVAETSTGRLWAFAIESPGVVTVTQDTMRWPNEALLYTLTDYQLLDSLAVEADGNVCVATLLNGGITVISPDGELVEFVTLAGDPIVTNIAFGGADMRTAYICAAGSGLLYQTEWRRPGLELNPRRGDVL